MDSTVSIARAPSRAEHEALRAAVAHGSRAMRLAVVTAFIAAYIVAGIALALPPTLYLILGAALTVAFQVGIARRPIRALWLVDARPFRLDWRGIGLALGLAALPAYLLVVSLQAGAWDNAAYELAALAGVLPAAWAIQAVDHMSARALARSLLTAGLVGVGWFAVLGFTTRGDAILADPGELLRTSGLSFLQYLPIVFVLEEVLFRGALDSYASGGVVGDRTSAFVVSMLWGAWHLPVTFAATGFSQLPVLLVFHTVLGLLYTGPWRRSGNLAVPGITHAVTDALRNALVAM